MWSDNFQKRNRIAGTRKGAKQGVSKHKLLLADDSITVQKVVDLTFGNEEIDVTIVGDGDTALAKIKEISPDIVLADVNMPGLNGYQLCEFIRKDEVMKDVPVILLVGSFEPFNVDEADRVGANAFLTKPFSSIPELIAQVSDLLNFPSPDDSTASDEEMPETHDIDALYEQSFGETIEIPDNGKVDSEFKDAGMDDEIIETTYADSLQGLQTDIPSDVKSEHVGKPIKIGEKSGDLSHNGDDAALDQPVIDHNGPDNAESESAVSNELDKSTEDELAGAETLSFDKVPSGNSESSHKFDELDLLELPVVADEKTATANTAESVANAEGNTQIVSLSPELIETIVKKVVEKLVEKR